MSYEDHFIEYIRLVPIDKRGTKLDDLIYEFVEREGVMTLISSMHLLHDESENFGGSPYQVMVDVIHRHLEQFWLSNQVYWYVMQWEEYPGEPSYYLLETDYMGYNDPKIFDNVKAGPFETEDEAVAWAEKNGVELEYAD